VVGCRTMRAKFGGSTGWAGRNAIKAPKAPATIAIDEGRSRRRIVSLVGNIPARDLRRADVQRMVDDIAARETAKVLKTKPRGKAVGLLGGIYTWAQRLELVPERLNPAHFD
jgi:hypothetical protein